MPPSPHSTYQSDDFGGKTIALVGRSGSGKSTLASLISRFYRHEQGSILFDDVDGSEYNVYSLRDKAALRHAVGYVIQQLGGQ